MSYIFVVYEDGDICLHNRQGWGAFYSNFTKSFSFNHGILNRKYFENSLRIVKMMNSLNEI